MDVVYFDQQMGAFSLYLTNKEIRHKNATNIMKEELSRSATLEQWSSGIFIILKPPCLFQLVYVHVVEEIQFIQ